VDILAGLEAYVSRLDGKRLATLDALIAPQLDALWLPDPRNKPQCDAYHSRADLLLYGGAAGGGKTELILGTGLTKHTRTVIFRRQATDLGDLEERLLQIAGRDGWNGQDKALRRDGLMIEFGHLEKPGSEYTWQGGLGHDLICFDEGAQLPRHKVQFVLGWLRSVDPKQRRRAIIASNPPIGAEGDWLIEWFAPWLDPNFPAPAEHGELRYAATALNKEGTTLWLDSGAPIVFETETTYRLATAQEIASGAEDVVTPLTRTFIPAKLADNPYLANTGYRAQLQALPEPIRSKLLHGDFLAGREDDALQVIPTAWIEAAQARWTSVPPRCSMTAIGVDVAQGGSDRTVVAARYNGWYAPLVTRSGKETREGADVAGLVVKVRQSACPVIVDIGGGWGADAMAAMERNGISCVGYLGLKPSVGHARDGKLKFANKRAESWWRMREELDPGQDGGSCIALPPSNKLKADLAAPRYDMLARGIKIEDKDDIRKRLGRSPDEGDAVVMAMAEGSRAAAQVYRRQNQSMRQSHANVGHGEVKRRIGL
jgi:hypothetical protein